MVPYIVLIVAIGALCLLAEASSISRSSFSERELGRLSATSRLTRSYFLWICVTVLVCFSALRVDVGTDFEAYVRFYDRLDPERWIQSLSNSTQEPGFTAMNLAMKSFTDSSQSLFWLCAVLTVPPVYLAFRKGSENPTFALFLYVLMLYPASFNASRQSVAAAFLVLAWVYLGESRVSFLIAAAVISTIHVSAILVAVVMIVVQLVGWSKRLVIALLLAVSATALAVNISPLSLNMLAFLNPEYVEYISSGESGLGAYLQAVFFATVLAISVTYGVEEAPLSKEERTYASFALVGIAFMIMGTQAVVVFRMSLFFLAFVILLVASRASRTRNIAPSLLISIGAVLYYFAYLLSYGDSVPYQSVLST